MYMAINEHFTDEQLVVQVREADKELYGEIIRRYQTRLAHYLRKFVRDRDELEDVLQNVFIKAYRNLYGFDVNKKFSPWLYRIAHNEALNHIKKYAKEVISLDEAEWELVDNKMRLAENIDAKLTKERVEKALVGMKEKYRAPLILYFFEQKSYEEISDVMRIPVNTVGTLIMRGKNQLKEFLSKQYGGQS